MNQHVSLTFSLKYLVNFSKSSTLSNTVQLMMSNDVPLLVRLVSYYSLTFADRARLGILQVWTRRDQVLSRSKNWRGIIVVSCCISPILLHVSVSIIIHFFPCLLCRGKLLCVEDMIFVVQYKGVPSSTTISSRTGRVLR